MKKKRVAHPAAASPCQGGPADPGAGVYTARCVVPNDVRLRPQLVRTADVVINGDDDPLDIMHQVERVVAGCMWDEKNGPKIIPYPVQRRDSGYDDENDGPSAEDSLSPEQGRFRRDC